MPVNYQLGRIYTLENTVNNTIYVGSTSQLYLSTRFSTHRRDSQTLTKKSLLYVAMREIGAQHFLIVSHHKFPCTSKDELEAEEYRVLKEFMKAGIPVYNTLVSKCGHKATEEAKLKMSLAKIGKVGAIKSVETKLKMSIANTGKTHSAETRLKLSISHIGKVGVLCGRFLYGSVHYDKDCNRWRFSWFNDAQVKSSKSFSCSKYGNWQAKLLAEDFRRTTFPGWRSKEELEIITLMNIDIE